MEIVIPIEAWKRIKALGEDRPYEYREAVKDVLHILLPEFKSGDFVVTTRSREDHAYIGEEPHQTLWVAIDGHPSSFTAMELANNREGSWRFTAGRIYPCYPYLDGENPPRHATLAEMAFLRGDTMKADECSDCGCTYQCGPGACCPVHKCPNLFHGPGRRAS
jgi:hypothetical protein